MKGCGGVLDIQEIFVFSGTNEKEMKQNFEKIERFIFKLSKETF